MEPAQTAVRSRTAVGGVWALRVLAIRTPGSCPNIASGIRKVAMAAPTRTCGPSAPLVSLTVVACVTI
jgi:hypothetical protein